MNLAVEGVPLPVAMQSLFEPLYYELAHYVSLNMGRLIALSLSVCPSICIPVCPDVTLVNATPPTFLYGFG
jgi:hypothetical protein